MALRRSILSVLLAVGVSSFGLAAGVGGATASEPAPPTERCDDMAVHVSQPDAASPPSYVLRAKIANSDTGQTQPISDGLELADDTDIGEPSWAPDGTALAFGAREDGQLRVVTSTGGPLTTLDLSGTYGLDSGSFSVAWSPLGDHISVMSSQWGIAGVHVLDLDRATLTHIGYRAYNPSGFPKQVAWTPDGSELAWNGVPDTETLSGGIFVARPDGSDQRVIAPGSGTPSWSPDGTTLAWGQFDPPHDGPYIRTGDSRGTSSTVVSTARTRWTAIQPTWSPDGRRLAWFETHGDDESVTVLDLESGQAEQIGTKPSPGYTGLYPTPTWSPNGQELAWVETSPGETGINIWSVRTGSIRRILEDDGDTVYGFAWRPMPFDDIAFTSFAWDDIACLFHLGITTGTSATTYAPTNGVTREQMAAFIARTWRSLGGTCDTTAPPFTDINPTSFARDDIACLYNLGITTGTSATTYAPTNGVTREQMAAFIARTWRLID